MIQIIPTILDFLSGICLSIGALYLLICWKKHFKGLYFSFSAVAVLLSIYLFLQRLMYLTADLQTFTLIAKIDMLVIPLIAIALVWSIAYYIDDKPMWALIAITLVNLTVIIINIFSPSSILYGSITGLESVIMPLGDALTLPLATINDWHFMLDISIMLLASFMVYAIIVLIRRGKKLAAAGWGISMMLIIAALIYDYLIVSNVIRSLYLFEYALVIFVLLMCTQLISDIVKSSIVRSKVVSEENKWRTLLENVDLIVVGLNRMGNVEYVNPYFLELTGYKENKVIGRDWFNKFLPRSEAYDVQGAFLEVLEHNFHPSYKNSIVTKSGEERLIKWYNVRITDRKGKMTGSMSIGMDITGQEK